MTNHFHLLLQPELGDDLSKWMQWLMTSHVRRYHRHYRSSGHIWQGRFKSFVISENDHLLAAIRYVEGNPVRAGMVTSALDWPWSSHRENAGTGSAGMAVPVPLDQEGEQQGEGQAPAEPVPGAVPVVDAGMVKLPSDWTDFVDTPLTLKELSRLGLAPARLPVPAFIDSDSLIGM
jgi:putative transposase